MAFSQGQTVVAGQLPNAIADLYTVPALTAVYVKVLRLANVSGVTVTGDIKKRFGGIDYSLFNFSLLAGEWIEFTDLILGAGDILRGVASVATSIDYIVEGVIES